MLTAWNWKHPPKHPALPIPGSTNAAAQCNGARRSLPLPRTTLFYFKVHAVELAKAPSEGKDFDRQVCISKAVTLKWQNPHFRAGSVSLHVSDRLLFFSSSLLMPQGGDGMDEATGIKSGQNTRQIAGIYFGFVRVKRQDSSACSFRPPGWFLHVKKCNKRRKEDRRMKIANTRHAKPLLGIKECKQVPYNVFGKLLLLSEETVASTRGKKGDLKTFCRELCTVSLQQTPPYQLKSGAVLPQTLQPSNLNPVKSQLNYQPNIPPIRGGLSSCLCWSPDRPLPNIYRAHGNGESFPRVPHFVPETKARLPALLNWK